MRRRGSKPEPRISAPHCTGNQDYLLGSDQEHGRPVVGGCRGVEVKCTNLKGLYEGQPLALLNQDS
jgi:hypothetical protein